MNNSNLRPIQSRSNAPQRNDASITLFVLTKNRKELLREMLQSIQKQSYENFECLILDNGSTDHTVDMIEQEFINDKRFSFESWEPKSSEENFQRAVTYGGEKGGWFAMLHDDDILLPSWLEQGVLAIAEFPTVAYVSINATTFSSDPTYKAFTWYKNGKNIIHLHDQAAVCEWMFKYSSMHFPSTIYRSEVFKDWKITTPFGKVSDQFMLMNASQFGGVAVVCTPSYKYRVHGLQDSSTYLEEDERDVWRMMHFIESHIHQNKSLRLLMYRSRYYLRAYISLSRKRGRKSFVAMLKFLLSNKAYILAPSDFGRIALFLLRKH